MVTPPVKDLSCEIDLQETTSPFTYEEDGEQAVNNKRATTINALLI
jgi:hypothetical protein